MCSSSNIESIIRKEGFYLFTGNGSSMWPLIRQDADTVEVRPATEPLKPGDVVLFRQDGRYVLHRVLATSDGTLTTRGDNNLSPETVPANAVVGVMTGLWRSEKKISLASLRYRLYKSLCLNCPRLFRVARRFLWR